MSRKTARRVSVALAMLCATAPAHAVSRTSVFEDLQNGAAEAGVAIMAYGDRMSARDMSTIQVTAFVLSGLIGLVGLWLLIRPGHKPPHHAEIIYAGTIPITEEEAENGPPTEMEPDRPARLLEAIAAAKAQIAISEAEKKHGR